MKRVLLAAVAALSMVGTADAAVITLQGVAANGPGDFTFTYQGTLGPDEGLRRGDRLIIYDFAGYVAGSIFSPSPDVVATVEAVSPGGLVTPGFDDSPDLVNLVFTYTGPTIRASGGPFPALDFDGLGARSTLGGLVFDAFYTLTTKNNPNNVPGGAGTPIYTLGSVSVPAAIPEPATWGLLLGGFGLTGFAMRRRRSTALVTYS